MMIAVPLVAGTSIVCVRTSVPSASEHASIQGQTFTLDYRLRAGVFTEVWRCTDRSGEARMVKLMNDSSAHSWTNAQLESNNIRRALQAARVTRVPDFYGMGEVHQLDASGNVVWNMPMMCMEFIEGGSLSSLKDQFQNQEGCISVVAQDIASALAQLHSAGIIHNDVKPDNVRVDRAGVSYICDFGISLFSADWSRHADMPIIGDSYYMAPEIARTNPVSYDEKRDIWALGVLAYELQVGSPLLVAHGVSPAGAYQFLSTVDQFHLNEVRESSKDLQRFLSACFEMDPRHRPSASKLLQHSFLLSARGSRPRDDVARFVRMLPPPGSHP